MADEEKEFIEKLLEDIERDERVLNELENQLNAITKEADLLERNLNAPERVIELKVEMMRLRYELDEFKRRRKERYH